MWKPIAKPVCASFPKPNPSQTQAKPKPNPSQTQAMASAVAMIVKFRDHIKHGDTIVSYDTETGNREDQGQYVYKPDELDDYSNLRIKWPGRVDLRSKSC